MDKIKSLLYAYETQQLTDKQALSQIEVELKNAKEHLNREVIVSIIHRDPDVKVYDKTASKWPQCQGKHIFEAIKIIKAAPGVKHIYVSHKSSNGVKSEIGIVDGDYVYMGNHASRRVVIYHDDNGIVTNVPQRQ